MSVRFAYDLRGADAAAALDWLHVHAGVAGVLELADGCRVWLTEELPALPFAAVVAHAVPVRREEFEVTGRELDQPILVAADLLVRPPWVLAPLGFAGIELVVPRGGAFGSGEHDSTKAALRCLHATWCAPASFADIGTGSGILACYAQRRGCPRILACDLEVPAVVAARELLPAADVRHGGPESLPPADAVVANLTAGELHKSLGAILACWTRRGLLQLGGLRAAEIDALVARVPAAAIHRVAVGAFTAVAFAASPG